MKMLSSKNKKGFTLVEVTVSLAIISVLILGVYSLIVLSIQITSDNKNYVTAIEIANQKMEQIRNMPYDDVGTIGGSATGTIPQIATSGPFTITTTIIERNDPYDGISSTTDEYWLDYKIVNIKVGWNSNYGHKDVMVSSRVIASTIEMDVGKGILILHSVDSSGAPVPSASVRIVNDSLGTDITTETDEVNGILTIPLATSSQGYKITVSKGGYSTAYSFDPASGESPVHQIITQGNITEESFRIDLLSTLDITVYSNNIPSNWMVNETASSTDKSKLSLSGDGSGNVYFAWREYEDAASSSVYMQKYNQSKVRQWSNDIKVAPGNQQTNPGIAVANNGYFHAVWQDDTDGKIYIKGFNSSGGQDWAVKEVDTSGDTMKNPKIAITENFGTATTTVVWEDSRNGNIDIYAQSFDINGNNIGDEFSVTSSSTNETNPAIVIDSDDNIYITWAESGDIYLQKFNFSGAVLWTNPINITSSNDDDYLPKLACVSNTNVALTWTSIENEKLNVYIADFDSSGSQLWKHYVNDSSLNKEQFYSDIATDDQSFFVTWTDDRNGNNNIYSQKFNLSGVLQWAGDQKITDDTDSSDQNSPVVIVNSNSNIFSAWHDERNNNKDIYAVEINTPGSLTPATNVPLVISGAKKIWNDPDQYKYNQTSTTNGSGVISLSLEWDSAYQIFASSTLTSLMVTECRPINCPISILANETKSIEVYVE